MNFLYESTDYEYIYAYIEEGKVQFICGYEFESACVEAVGGGKIVLNDGRAFESEECASTLKAGDVVNIYRNNVSKADEIKVIFGEYCTDSDGKSYFTEYAWINDTFAPGEECIAYLDTYGRHIKYLKKNYENSEVLFITGVEKLSFGNVFILTQKGIKELPEKVYIDGVIYSENDILDRLSQIQMNSGVIYYRENSGKAIIDTLDVIRDIRAQYNEKVSTIGGYYITKDMIAANVDGEIYTDFNLTDGALYKIKVYSSDGLNASFVLFENCIDAITEKMYILVTEITDSNITGYVKGEEITVDCNAWNWNFNPGDMVLITRRKNEILSAEKLIPFNYDEKAEYVSGNVIFMPVSRIAENYLFMDGPDICYSLEAGPETKIYKVDVKDGTVKKAQLSDIYYNPVNVYEGDRILAKKNGITAEFIVIYKY